MISELAYIDSNAIIGEGVTVQPFAYIEGDVEIGKGTIVASGAKILNGARIGENCHIHSGAVVSGDPQDLKFVGEKTTCRIGNNTTIRECATISKGTKAKGVTIVGEDCLIMAYAHVAHDCVIGNRVILVNGVSIAGEVEIGDWAILGGHVAIHQFVKIGRHVMISGGSLIGKDIPPYVIVGQFPAQFVGLNSVGLRRRGFTSDDMTLLQDIYRILFKSGLNFSNACSKISSDLPDSEYKNEIIKFVEASSRGIIKPDTRKSED